MEFASPTNISPPAVRPQAPPVKKATAPNKRGPVAREAQHQDDSMRDFADFIRSTGPDSDPRTLAKQSVERPEITRVTSAGSQASFTKQPSRKITKQQPVVSPKKSEQSLPARGNSKLKARDPIASPTNTTAELADFFRSGPPTAQAQSAPRSASSPQVNGRSREGVGSGTSVASTQDSFAPSKKTQSSVNSRTALLDSTNRSVPTKTDYQRQQEAGGPVRKQRRVKDPYALDSDEDEEMAPPPEPEPSEEETLSDFLKNYSPPSTAKTDTQQRTSSALSNTAQPSQTDLATSKRKAPGVSMRERIARNIAVIPDYRPMPPKEKSTSKNNHANASPHVSPPSSNERRNAPTPKPPVSSPITSNNPTNRSKPQPQPQPTAPQLPPLTSVSKPPRPTSPHLTQNGTRLDTLRPSQPTYSAARASGKPKMQARAESTGAGAGGGMSDLANFLKETEPPTSGPAMGPPPGGKAAKMMGATGAVGVGGMGNSVTGGEGVVVNGAGTGKEGGKWRMWGKKK